MTTLEKTYDPQAIERRWYEHWEESGFFSPRGDGAPYCIMIPPPNVTGTLHMGHAFQDTIMDTLIRYHRMCGERTLWQPGSDHAGIATQMVVERQLNAEGASRHDLGREAFVERVWQWKEQSAFITNTSNEPSRFEIKAIFFPSGDQTASISYESEFVSLVCSEPSAFIT